MRLGLTLGALLVVALPACSTEMGGNGSDKQGFHGEANRSDVNKDDKDKDKTKSSADAGKTDKDSDKSSKGDTEDKSGDDDKVKNAAGSFKTKDGDKDDSSSGKTGDSKDDSADGDKKEFADAQAGEDHGPCPLFDKDPTKNTLALTGGPSFPVNVKKYKDGGSGTWEGDDYVFNLKSYDVQGVNYPTLDAVPRNAPFTAQDYKVTVKDAKSDQCQALALTDGAARAESRTGCFLETTRITMADGSTKLARDIVSGDKVQDPLTGKGVEVTEIVKGTEDEKGMIEVGTGLAIVVVTPTHPFLTARGMQQAQELTKADQLLGTDGRFHAMTHLAHRPVVKGTKVFNLVVGGDKGQAMQHMVLADGVVSGDLYLQRQLEMGHRAPALTFVGKSRSYSLLVGP